MHGNRAAARLPLKPGSVRGFSLVELATTVAVLAILAALAIPAYRQVKRRAFDSAALSDTVNVGKAIDAMDSTTTFSRTVRGPGRVPNVPGAYVSRGTTLVVQRTRSRTGVYSTYVRGTHSKGVATFYYRDGRTTATGARL